MLSGGSVMQDPMFIYCSTLYSVIISSGLGRSQSPRILGHVGSNAIVPHLAWVSTSEPLSVS